MCILMHHQQPCGVPTAFDTNNANYIPRGEYTTKLQKTERLRGVYTIHCLKKNTIHYNTTPPLPFS